MLITSLIDRLPRRLQWAPHNLIAHPIGEVWYLLTGSSRFGNWIHDLTLPTDHGDAPRG